jgi:hypothetical protein
MVALAMAPRVFSKHPSGGANRIVTLRLAQDGSLSPCKVAVCAPGIAGAQRRRVIYGSKSREDHRGFARCRKALFDASEQAPSAAMELMNLV